MTTTPVHVERVGNRIGIWSDDRIKELVTQVPGAVWNSDLWDRPDSIWHAPLSWATCKVLRGVFGERLVVHEQLAWWSYEEYRDRVYPALILRNEMDTDGYAELRGYQRVGVAFLKTVRDALLGDDRGTGKTVMGSRAIRELHDEGNDVFPSLIVAPNSVKAGWEREFKKWGIPDAKLEVLRGRPAKRRQVFDRVASGETQILVMNWDLLQTHSRLASYGSVRLQPCSVCDPASTKKQSSCHRCPKELNEIAFKLVIADEVHRAKDPKSNRTRALWAIGDQPTVAWRWGLTGTPIGNAIDDLWAILRFLSPGEFPAKTKFVERYALQSWNAFGGIDIVGIRPEHKDEFFSIFDARFLRRPKELVLPWLPPKVPDTRYVDLTPKQKRVYNELADEMVARLDNGDTVLATNPLQLRTRLLQAASAFMRKDDCAACGATGMRADTHEAVPHPDPNWAGTHCRCAAELVDPMHETKCRRCSGHGFIYVLEEPSSKLDELEAIIEERPDEQLVVFAVSRQLIELAEQRLAKPTKTRKAIPYVSIHGKIEERQRDLNVQAFRAGEARVCFVTIDAGGEGLDGLQVAQTAVFLERHYSYLMNVQAEDRLHRDGQQGSVLIIHVRAEGTVEDDKEEIIAAKEYRFEELVRDQETLRRMLEIRPT